MATKEEAGSRQEQESSDGGQGLHSSGAVRAVAAAAATGAATYAVRRAMSHRDPHDETDEDEQNPERDGSEAGSVDRVLAKKEDVAEKLSAKTDDLKKAAAKLRPKRNQSTFASVASAAWDSASQQLLPLAGEASAAVGKAAAEKGPDVLRKTIIPRFIEAFQKAG